MSRFEVAWELESETAVTIDRGASLPLLGAGSIDVSPSGVKIIGDEIRTLKTMAVLAGSSAFIGMFALVLMTPTAIAVALGLFALSALAFVKRRKVVRAQHIDVSWANVSRVAEASLDGQWRITLKQPAGTACVRISDADKFSDEIAAIADLGLARVTFRERELASAVVHVK